GRAAARSRSWPPGARENPQCRDWRRRAIRQRDRRFTARRLRRFTIAGQVAGEVRDGWSGRLAGGSRGRPRERAMHRRADMPPRTARSSLVLLSLLLSAGARAEPVLDQLGARIGG